MNTTVITVDNDCLNCSDGVKNCRPCCRSCPPCPNCYDLGLEKVQKYLYAIDDEITDYYQTVFQIKNYGYSKSPVREESFQRLVIYRDYLKHYFDSTRRGYDSEMCPNEVQEILEKTSLHLSLLRYKPGTLFTNVGIDSANFESWVASNPFCVPWESWQKYIIPVCPKIGITIEGKGKVQDPEVQLEIDGKEQVCNLALDIRVNNITDSCKFLTTLSLIEKARCQNSVDISIENVSECKINYEVLVEEHKCDISFDSYLELLKCNLSHKAIVSLHECGAEVLYDSENLCPVVKTPSGELSLKDVSIDIFGDRVDSCQLETTLGVSQDCVDNDFFQEVVKSYKTLKI